MTFKKEMAATQKKHEGIARGGSIQKKKEDSICELISKSAGLFQEKFPT